MAMKPNIDSYLVLGNPVSHSKSPRIHALFAQQTGQRLLYEAQCVAPGHLPQALAQLRDSGGRGANITLPFKEDAFRWVDACSVRAGKARAVNTIIFREDGSSFGDNTDGVGIVHDLTRNLGAHLKDRRILILGAGGAVRGALGSILDEEPESIAIANRNVEKAESLAAEFSIYGAVHGYGYAQLQGQQQYDLVINGTSASLQGQMPVLPDGLLNTGSICYDMMYGPAPTIFMQWAAAHGAAQVADGLGMLVEQAAEAFYLWRGVHPQTAAVIELLRQELKVE